VRARAGRAGPGAPAAAGGRRPGRPLPAWPPAPRHSVGTMPACPRPWSLAHDPEITRGGVEPTAAVLGADDDVLDPGPVAALGVEAGLDREGHAGFQPLVVAGHDVGVLVLLQADPVPGAVQEQRAVAGGDDRAAAGGGGRPRGRPRADRGG